VWCWSCVTHMDYKWWYTCIFVAINNHDHKEITSYILISGMPIKVHNEQCLSSLHSGKNKLTIGKFIRISCHHMSTSSSSRSAFLAWTPFDALHQCFSCIILVRDSNCYVIHGEDRNQRQKEPGTSIYGTVFVTNIIRIEAYLRFTICMYCRENL
jgi:hypothetical protein